MEQTLHNKIAKALLILRPGAEWVLRGNDYESLEWLDAEQTQPTWAEIEAEINNPTPMPEPTVEEKLAKAGLSIDDLKAALGL